jgi:thiol-disulfide isomerase/thioredoxin
MTDIKIKTSIIIIFSLFANNAIAQTSAINKGKIHYITDTVSSFDSLIGKFKGKIIYVDIWASWCQPCRFELKQKSDVKGFEDFALNNDIVTLYICCDKDGNKWKSFITQNNLTGYHILVNHYVNDDLHTKFAFFEKRNGQMKKGFYIPRHLIIDKKGFVVDSMADRQGSSSVYTVMKKLIHDMSN